jgi:hypothetical protein
MQCGISIYIYFFFGREFGGCKCNHSGKKYIKLRINLKEIISIYFKYLYVKLIYYNLLIK